MEKLFSLTEPQKAIWLTEQFYQGYSVNNVSGTCFIYNRFNKSILKQAIYNVVKNNSSLRIRLTNTANGVMQYFSSFKSFPISNIKLNNIQELASFENEFSSKTFKLFESSLFRVKIFNLKNGYGGMVFVCHHLITDGYSLGLLCKKIIREYNRLDEQKGFFYKIFNKAKDEETTEELNYEYYINKEQEYFESDKYKIDKKYWEDRFENIPNVVSLSKNSNVSLSPVAKRLTFDIDNEMFEKIQEICTKNRTSIFNFFMSSLGIFIYRMTHMNRFVIGTPTLNRRDNNDKSINGDFASVEPLLMDVDDQKDFNNFSKQVAIDSIGMLKHSRYPINEILKYIRSTNSDYSGMYNVLLNYQLTEAQIEGNVKYNASWNFNNCNSDEIDIGIYDFNQEGKLTISYDYKIEKFSEQDVEKIHERFMYIITQILSHNGNIKIADIDEVLAQEYYELLDIYNSTYQNYDKSKTIIELFEEQVQKTPDKVAVTFKDETITYKELNEKANIVGNFLREKYKIKSDDFVAILQNRSIDMIVSILGVVKSGATYVAVDPDYPEDRVEYMLLNCKAKVMLINGYTQSIADKINDIDSIKIDDIYKKALKSKEKNNKQVLNLNIITKPEDLLYVIYTSGSTGKPKGVCIQNYNVHNLIVGMRKIMDFIKVHNFACLATCCFDMFVFELWGSLLNGLNVVLADEDEQKIPPFINKMCINNNVDVLQTTPSRLKLLFDNNEEECLKNIKHIFIGGEAVNNTIFEQLLKYKNMKIHHMYGPTETTVWSTHKLIKSLDDITIGNPISNTDIYILNDDKLMPKNNEGEICIGGDGVGRGYLGKLKRTNLKYVQNIFKPSSKMYRTGDYGYINDNNELVYIGRSDGQVKINGYRVELTEIENNILKYPDINNAVVAKKSINTQDILCGYIISDKEININDLKKHLQELLPIYMVPKYIIQMKKFPYTQNGKIDRKSMPIPKLEDSQEVIVGARNDVDVKLISEITKTLELPNISIDKNLFEIGLDSLLAINLSVYVLNEFGVQISVNSIFNNPTIEQISDLIVSNPSFKGDLNDYIQSLNDILSIKKSRIEKVKSQDYYEVSDNQRQIYLACKNSPKDSLLYNISGAIEFTQNINIEILKNSLLTLLNRHEAFKTSFDIKDEKIVQIINDNVNFNIELEKIENNKDYINKNKTININKLLKEFIKPFDLKNAPLIRFKIVVIKEQVIVLINSHHMICDGASLNILVQELGKLYSGENLPEIKLTYKDYSSWELQEKNKKEEAFWIQQFKDEVPLLNLPTEKKRPLNRTFEGSIYSVTIENELFDGIRKLARQYNTTPNILMLCCYYVLLYKYTGQKDFVVGTPISGRTMMELNDIVGLFINILPIRLKMDGNLSVAQTLDILKEICSNCYNNQHIGLDSLSNKISNAREKSRNFLFDTLFVYQSNNYTKLNFETLQGNIIRANTGTSKYDISLEIMPNDDNFFLTFEYSLELFDEEYIKDFAKRYINIISQVVNNINLKLANVEMLDEVEKHYLLYDLNNTHKKIDYSNSIVKMFEKQAKQMAKKVAIVFEDMQITYEELNKSVNQLARFLLEQKIDESSFVAIMLPRRAEVLVAILACLKAGKCYIPMDVTYPKRRINYMLNNSKTSVILTSKDVINQYDLDSEKYNIIDIEFGSNVYTGTDSNLDLELDINIPSYAIYTSGSTGLPKGIVLTQKALTNLANYLNDYVDIFKDKRKNQSILSITTMSFDIFIFETIMSLQAGLKIIFASDAEQNSLVLLDQLINRFNVKAIQATPSKMNIFVQNISSIPHLNNITTFVLAGEPLPELLRDELLKISPKAKVYNGYGPSETTVFSTFTDVTKQSIINIGKPLLNTDMYVLDEDDNLLPEGIPGELYIAGDGVGLGYINNEKITKERFVNNPFENSLSSNMYKTGDIVKWQNDGTLKYIGRNDNQVKIRGLRIELDEIEKCILKNKNVKKCIIHVIRDDAGRDYIVAYVLVNEVMEVNELKQFVTARLPKYMVPAYFVIIDKIPYLPNGKIDKNSLPKPNYEIDVDKEYNPPQNSIQIEIVNIFEKLLNVNPISIDDDFFVLGGDSLLVINLQIELNKLGYNITYADLFKNTTVRSIDEFIRTHNNLNNISSGVVSEYIYDEKVEELNKSIKDYTRFTNDTLNKVSGNILITGATGYLGSHVLEQFLLNDKCLIYVLLRPQKGLGLREKLKNKLHHYFGEKYDDQIDKRIIIISGDISKPNLGVNARELSLMLDNITTIINCAALVSHYGNYATFEVMNVLSVKNLLELCKNNYKKFIQISTVSISGVNLFKNTSNRQIIFAENDLYVGQPLDNVYVRSKFEAEKLVIDYINQGVDAYIFRIGNLTNRYSDLKFQPNVQENAFVSRLVSFIKIGVVPKQLLKEHIEFTPVDSCSQAIFLLTKTLNKKNRIFHLFDSNHVGVKEFVRALKKFNKNVEIVEDKEFVQKVAQIELQDNGAEILSGILKDMDSTGNFQFHSNVKVSNDFTVKYLDKIGFNWPKINDKYLNKFIEFLLDLM